ncbi:MAG: hypothetical protein DCF20_15905 [Pseudanabaena sp.]|nr:MAG: hypothetical protein DCF20_15905 [Pseudanabaena sp.]
MDIETIRTEALRKLGRNIVNFSKIEGALKYLLSIAKNEGNRQKLSDKLLGDRERINKQTLGTLVRDFYKNVLGNAIQADFPEDDPKWVSILLNISYSDQEFLKIKKQEFLGIVAERNKLIHQDLANLDTSSIEDYRKLIIYLDEQNPRLLNYLAELGEIINTHTDMIKIGLEEMRISQKQH